jgi:hypothetical protein
LERAANTKCRHCSNSFLEHTHTQNVPSRQSDLNTAFALLILFVGGV